MPPNTVKVTRPGPFGNPFQVGQDYGAGPLTAADAVELFRTDPLCQPIWERAGKELRGKNLACGAPAARHADVRLKIANREPMKRKTMSERQRLALRERFNELFREDKKQNAYDHATPAATELIAWCILLAYVSQPKSTSSRRRRAMEIGCAAAMK